MGSGGYHGPIGGPSPILRYFVDLTGKKNPRVCFLPTAGGDNKDAVNNFVQTMYTLGVHAGYLLLFNPPTWNLEEYLADYDAILCSGGHTRNMVALWREWNLDQILTRAWKRGVVLGGGSAGALCWYEQGITDSVYDSFEPMYNGLGLCKGSFCPHYAHPRGRWRAGYMEMVQTGKLVPGYACTDRAALHYINDKVAHKIVESPDAAIYWVKKDGQEVKQEVETLPTGQLLLSPSSRVTRRSASRKGKTRRTAGGK
jgi:peptidase E